MNRIKDAIKSIITYIIWIFIAVPLLCLCALLTLLPASIRYDNRIYFALGVFLSRVIMRASFLSIHVEGLENVPTYPHDPAIFLANHTSSLDIPVVETLLGNFPRIWFSKKSYLQVPVFGFILKRLHVPIDATSPHKARQGLETAFQRANQSLRHILIFPEGRRFDDGNIHKFFSGFAVLAQKLNRPVIPIVISGLHKAYPKGSFFIASSGQTIKIKVGKPMYFDSSQTPTHITTTMNHYFEQELKKLGE